MSTAYLVTSTNYDSTDIIERSHKSQGSVMDMCIYIHEIITMFLPSQTHVKEAGRKTHFMEIMSSVHNMNVLSCILKSSGAVATKKLQTV